MRCFRGRLERLLLAREGAGAGSDRKPELAHPEAIDAGEVVPILLVEGLDLPGVRLVLADARDDGLDHRRHQRVSNQRVALVEAEIDSALYE